MITELAYLSKQDTGRIDHHRIFTKANNAMLLMPKNEIRLHNTNNNFPRITVSRVSNW